VQCDEITTLLGFGKGAIHHTNPQHVFYLQLRGNRWHDGMHVWQDIGSKRHRTANDFQVRPRSLKTTNI